MGSDPFASVQAEKTRADKAEADCARKDSEIATLRQRVEHLTQCRQCKRALHRLLGPICAACSGAP